MHKSKIPKNQRYEGVVGTYMWLESNPRQVALMLYALAQSKRHGKHDIEILNVFIDAIESQFDTRGIASTLQWNLKHFFQSKKMLAPVGDATAQVRDFDFGEDAAVFTYDNSGLRLSEAF